MPTLDPPLLDLAAWRARGSVRPLLGHAIFHVDSAPDGAAQRPALLLVHGFPTASWDFAKLWPALVRDFRVVAADMLGFGFSAKPKTHRYSIFEQADLLEALVAELGIERYHVLAHDYGDTVAQELLARDRERRAPRLASVCLLNGGLFPETHRALPIQKLLLGPLGPLVTRLTNRRAFERSMRRIFGAHTPPSADELDSFWRLVTHDEGHRIFHRLIPYMRERRENRERWVGALTEAHVPLALVAGMDDPISGGHMVARYREVVGHGYVAELAGIGHYPQVEDPALVLEHFRAFIAGARAPRSPRLEPAG